MTNEEKQEFEALRRRVHTLEHVVCGLCLQLNNDPKLVAAIRDGKQIKFQIIPQGEKSISLEMSVLDNGEAS
jgi:hypothetical protein